MKHFVIQSNVVVGRNLYFVVQAVCVKTVVETNL